MNLGDNLRRIQEDPLIAKALAVMIAEHEAFKARLVELGEIYNEVPARWTATGEPCINLTDVIAEHKQQSDTLILPPRKGVLPAVQNRVEQAAISLMGSVDAALWWLNNPNPDLGGRKPVSYLTHRDEDIEFLEEFIRSSDGKGYG
jgi:hypothetical protein